MTGHTRIHFSGPIAKPGWQRRLYPVAELLMAFAIPAAVLLIGFVCTWTGK